MTVFTSRGEVVWAPQSKSQSLYLTCPVFELIGTGDRGGAKTDCLIMSFLQHVGKGYGRAWKGTVFRESYKQAEEVIDRIDKWATLIFPGVRSSRTEKVWRFPQGERLQVRYLERPDDYKQYHGWQEPWIGHDELTNQPTPEGYLSLMSICRSPHPEVPRMYRSNCNPRGPGHNWVKRRFVDAARPGQIVREELKVDGVTRIVERVRLRLPYVDNKIFIDADPNYRPRLAASTTSEASRRAWLYEDWSIQDGGRFDSIWTPEVHIIEPFEIPPGWRIDRSFDWGESKPSSVGFWAESDGSEATLRTGERKAWPKGTLFRIAEIYVWTGEENQGVRTPARDLGRRIYQFEREHPLLSREVRGRSARSSRVQPGPADSSIFGSAPGQESVANAMDAVGVEWLPADKSSGSRVRGWAAMYQRLAAAVEERDGRLVGKWPMEDPGLFIFSTCRDGWLRTVPKLQCDKKHPDDVDTSSEDHCADETRYRVLASPSGSQIIAASW